MQSIVPQEHEAYYSEWHFSPAVAHRDLIFLSGVTGYSPVTGVPADPREQFVQAFESLGLVLRAAGADFGDIIEMTTYHVGLRDHLDLFRAIKDRYIQLPYPAWSAIGVSELATEGILLEIRVVCRVPEAE